MNSETPNPLEAPLIVVNSFGFSGAETLATFLASHAEIGLLPGQNFIQQEHTLYRPLSIPANDAETCFELLATKQYTKAGLQWAGLGKFMSDEYAACYSEKKHRSMFVEQYEQLSDIGKTTFTDLIKVYTQCFFACMGENTDRLSHYGFYGANLLLNASAYPQFQSETRVLQVKPSPAQWLALASQTRTWDPEEALTFYLIQNLIIAHCERLQDNIHSLGFEELVKDTHKCLNRCCEFLGVSGWNNETPKSGRGHPPATQPFFNKIFDDADKITAIYANSDWFEIANSIDDWCDSFLDDAKAVALLEKYRDYWNSTSHIAFDWSGPLENQIKDIISEHARRKTDHFDSDTNTNTNTDNPNIAYQFYQQWYNLNSIDHLSVGGKAMYPLGRLEAEIPVPKLQYFLRIAINYVQTSVKLQGEKLHSYHNAKHSHLYKILCSEEIQTLLDKNFLRDAFNDMQATVNHTEALFVDLKETGLANAKTRSKKTSISHSKPSLNAKITDEEMSNIAVSGPDITEHENKLVARAMSDWYQQPYYFCETLENRFAAYHHRNYALMTPSCTTAHHLLLMGLGIGPGDEVLVPEATWIASATPIYYTGATPVYCDIDTDDWCISVESLKNNLTAKTRAIVAVNVYGNMAKMDELESFAKQHHLHLIEDAAESVGSVYRGRKSGEFGVGSVFSFHRTKTMTTGEGGMLLMDDEALFHRCVKLRDHGRGPDTPAFTHDIVGHKYMPFNVQAALGLAQFERLDKLVDKKRHILHFYKERLAHYDNLQFNPEPPDVYNSAWCSTLILGPDYSHNKTSLMAALQIKSVPSRPFFYPLSSQPGVQAKHGANVDLRLKNPNAFAISDRGINLPSALNLNDIQLDYVCSVLEDILNADLVQATSNRKKAA